MSDLIRRQDAIDAVRGRFSMPVDNMILEVIGNLPSAQPEPTCEQVMEYCKKRCMSLVTNEFLAHMFLTSTQPELRWIPVSERLPEEDMEVLISYRYKEGEGDTSHVDIDITTYGQMYFGGRVVAGLKHWRPPFEYFESNYEVVAWMPLPEPYKGDEEHSG